MTTFGVPLKNGIPGLVKNLSLSPPSIPTEEEHLPADILLKHFEPMSTEEFSKIEHEMTRIWLDANENGSVDYASENDIAALVSDLVKDLNTAMGLELKAFTEVEFFGLRPDVWVVTWNMLPVGVIAVKKPDEESKSVGERILDMPTVLGELYDFQMQLPNFYGMTPAFGILTMFETWQVCWIPTEAVDVDGIARTSESCPMQGAPFTTPKNQTAAKKTSPPGLTPSKLNPTAHRIEEEEEEEEEATDAEVEEGNRVLHASKVYDRKDEDNIAMRAVAAALSKMKKSTVNSFSDPFDNLQGRRLLRFTKGLNRSLFWCRLGKLEGTGKWNKYANPQKYLYAIEDLGRCADGRVWLTCTSSGAVCVL